MELIVTALHKAMSTLGANDIGVKRVVFGILLRLSIGDNETVLDQMESGHLPTAIVKAAIKARLDAVPPVTAGDVEG